MFPPEQSGFDQQPFICKYTRKQSVAQWVLEKCLGRGFSAKIMGIWGIAVFLKMG